MFMMILFVCYLICLLFPTISGQSRTSPYIINNADAQQIWASTFGGLRSAGTSSIAGGAIDPNDGSLVLTGGATGTFLGHDSMGDWDGFVIKMTPQGSLVWIRWFATVTLDYVVGAAIDLNGNIYITGYASAPLQGLPATTGSDVFVARLDPNGDQQWISSLSTSSSDKSSDIGVDIFGFCYVTWGHNSAVFLSKFHSNGTRLYSQNYAATSGSSTFIGGNIVEAQRGLSVINPIANVTNTVSIVVSFTVSNPLTYQYAQFTNLGGNDVIVALVSASTGLPIWSRIYQTPADDIMAGIKSDSSGSIYVTGSTGAAMEGERFTGITNSNIFLSKLTFDGTKLWTVQYGAVTANVASQNLAVDNAGGVFVVGTNDQVQAFTMVDGYPTMYGVVSQAFAYPSILSKFDSDGFRLWTSPFCSYMPARTLGYYPQMLSRLVVVDPASGQIYVGGYKNGLYTGDVDVVPAFPDAQINLNQAVVIGMRQPPANVSLAQWQTLLDQLSTLLATN